MMKRLFCWLVAAATFGFSGHVWRITRMNGPKHIALLHLHAMAGLDCVCERCGAEWKDAAPFLLGSFWTPPDGERHLVYAWDMDPEDRARVDAVLVRVRGCGRH